MRYTADSPFKSAPRISRSGFRDMLFLYAAPGVVAERDPGAYFDAISAYGVDPLFLLAMFNHESSLGHAGVATTTHSWGNTRLPNFGPDFISMVTGRSGEFPVFRDWLDGCKSTAARLVEPTWVYAGRTAIREIFDHPSGDVWAPAGDMNDPAGYLRAVLDFMNKYAEEGQPMAGDDSRFTWAPDVTEFGYPQGTHGRNGKNIDYLIIHVTEGTDSAAWLRDGNGSSTHYLTNRDATPREQHVAEADAAWTPGNGDYAQRSINIEFERFSADDWTDAELANAVATCAPIIARHNIPIAYLGRENASQRGIIGHQDVPDGAGGWGGTSHHSDPGPKFPWAKFIAGLKAGGNVPSQPTSGDDPVTHKFIHQDFRAYFDSHGGVDMFGRPVSGAFNEGDRLTQYFERAVMQSFPENKEPYTVQLRLLGAEELARKYPTGAPA